MPRATYSDEAKAAALAALLAGQSVAEVAKAYRVPPATLRSWKSRQGGDGVATVATEKKEALGDLLAGYLDANLRALTAQALVVADPEWIREQPASDLAVLHGVMTDKAVRLLEAFGREPEDADADA